MLRMSGKTVEKSGNIARYKMDIWCEECGEKEVVIYEMDGTRMMICDNCGFERFIQCEE